MVNIVLHLSKWSLTDGLVVIDWKPYKHADIYKAIVRAEIDVVACSLLIFPQIDIWGAAGQEDYAAVTSQTGEPILESMLGTETEVDMYIKDTSISAFELFQVQKGRAALRKEYLDHWQGTRASTSTGRPVDAIISPVAPFPPPRHGKNTCVPILASTQSQC